MVNHMLFGVAVALVVSLSSCLAAVATLEAVGDVAERTVDAEGYQCTRDQYGNEYQQKEFEQYDLHYRELLER